MVEPSGPRYWFEGRARTTHLDETILDGLAREGLPNLQRSPRYHRPRAPFCGIGQCTGCLVRVNGRPNVRACRYVPSEGDRVETENAWPSRRFDLLASFDFVFRNGIDTLHGFRKPAFLTPLFHRVVRRLAGYGEPPSAESAAGLTVAPEIRTTEIAIVGAGRSGRAAAAALVAAGVPPVVLDRRAEVPEIPGAELLLSTTATFLPGRSATPGAPFEMLGYTEPAKGVLIRAQHVVVATGSYDASLLFESNDRPGVMTGDGAMALSRAGRPPPFRRAVVFGAGSRARAIVERFGDQVSAVVALGEIPPEVVRAASDAGIPLYPRSLLCSTVGRSRISGVVIRSRGDRARATLECDALVLAHRRLPNGQLFFQAGARMGWRGGTGAYYPLAGDDGATNVPGVWAIGSASGALGPASPGSGERVASALTGGSVPMSPLERVRPDGPNELEGYYRELLREPRNGRWIACPCEDVLLDEIEAATRAGYRGVEVVKRYTGVGTGLCQGRYCLPDALLLLSIAEGRPPSEVGYITQRPPVHPTPMAALAALCPAVVSSEPTG
ncbi:MAG: 2Fe-2S iron-sulfur cluster-binding protein [Thermoplasmata archaeon]|nr:2Fe-2S iron-sulfur cluster-binding protein [Thermoplasmata archaeon]